MKDRSWVCDSALQHFFGSLPTVEAVTLHNFVYACDCTNDPPALERLADLELHMSPLRIPVQLPFAHPNLLRVRLRPATVHNPQANAALQSLRTPHTLAQALQL